MGLASIFLMVIIAILSLTVDVGNDQEKVLEQLKATIEKQDQKLMSEIKALNGVEEKLNFLESKSDRKMKDYLWSLFNQQLPMDAELDYVAISGNQIMVKGNANNIAAVNEFYENFFKGPKFNNAKIDTYQRVDVDLHFFEISANLSGR